MKIKKLSDGSILKRLEEYGDSILEDDSYEKSKKKKPRKRTHELSQPVFEIKGNEVTRRMKKNRRKKEKKKLGTNSVLVEEKHSSQNTFDNKNIPEKSEVHVLKGNRHLQELQSILGTFSNTEQKPGSEEDEQIESSRKKEDTSSTQKRQGPEIVVYEDPRKRKKAKSVQKAFNETNQDEEKLTEIKTPKLNINRLRYEVIKFGMKGFEKEKEEEAKIALAIKLGAKPPKRQYINYKELIAKRKKEKAEEEAKIKEDSLNSQKFVKKSTKKPVNKNKVAGFDSQPGKHRDGVQILRGVDFKKFKRKQ